MKYKILIVGKSMYGGWLKKNYRVFVIGSNSKMMRNEIATTLGGMFMIKEIQPLLFKEFLQF